MGAETSAQTDQLCQEISRILRSLGPTEDTICQPARIPQQEVVDSAQSDHGSTNRTDTPVGNSLWLLIALLVHAQHGSILDDTDRARAQISMRETEGMLTGGFLH